MIITLNDLKLKAQNYIPDLNYNIVIIILYADNDIDIAEAETSLFEIFDEDDNQYVIKLISQREEIGYINQEDIYSFVRPLSKGIDNHTGFETRGPIPSPKVKYKCPYAYQRCNQRYWITGRIENISSNLPDCKKHRIPMVKEK